PMAKKAVQKKVASKKTVAKKTAAKKGAAAKKHPVPAKKAASHVSHAPSHSGKQLPKVRVQMFRQGLGDSFLVTFDAGGTHERRMLIDCGTLGNKQSEINTAAIAEHLQTLIDGGKKIDFLIATHEHQDHLSGFKKDLRPVLKGNVGEVW